MSVNAQTSQGTVLQIGSGSPISYDPIGEIISFTGPGGAAQVIDVTDLDSEAKEKLMGLRDEGQVSFTINFVPGNTQHAALRTARADRTLTTFQIVFADDADTTWTFTAYVTGFSIAGGVDNVLSGNVTLEITGAIEES